LPLRCEVVEKTLFWAQIGRGGYTPISDMHFQVALTSDKFRACGCWPILVEFRSASSGSS